MIFMAPSFECCTFLVCVEIIPFILNFIFYMQVGPTGKVVGIEHIEDLVRTSVKNVQADDPELLTSGRIKLVGKGGGVYQNRDSLSCRRWCNLVALELCVNVNATRTRVCS